MDDSAALLVVWIQKIHDRQKTKDDGDCFGIFLVANQTDTFVETTGRQQGVLVAFRHGIRYFQSTVS